jgi:hypothetical protein
MKNRSVFIVSIVLIILIFNGCTEQSGEDKKSDIDGGNENEDQNNNGKVDIFTGNYTNSGFFEALENETLIFRERYIDNIYPSPKPIPEKLNCIWVALPSMLGYVLKNIDEIKEMGFNSVHFGPPVIRDESNNPVLVGLELIKFYINEFHRENMYVVLTTNPAGPWFGSPYEGDIDFMSKYSSEIIYEIAEVAEKFDVAAFIPANEYQLLAQNHDIISEIPQELLPNIRERYGGMVGFNIQGRLEYALEGYDFVLMMGRTAYISDPLGERIFYLDHHADVVREDVCFMRNLTDGDLWYGFLLFSGKGNYWEPNNNDPHISVKTDEAAQYANMVLETSYEDVSCIMPGYDTGFYVFEEPLPQTWENFFSSYNQTEQIEPPWLNSDLDIIFEVFFPEWDSMYALPWNEMITPGYRVNLTSNKNITVNGTATYVSHRKIVIEDFCFEKQNREIEIRLADDRTIEEVMLVNIARLFNICNVTYDKAKLTLYWPDYLSERDFNYLIIYDKESMEVLGKYEFLPPEE